MLIQLLVVEPIVESEQVLSNGLCKANSLILLYHTENRSQVDRELVVIINRLDRNWSAPRNVLKRVVRVLLSERIGDRLSDLLLLVVVRYHAKHVHREEKEEDVDQSVL